MQRLLSSAKCSLQDIFAGTTTTVIVDHDNTVPPRVRQVRRISFCCQCSEGTYTVSWNAVDDSERCVLCQEGSFRLTGKARCLICNNFLCKECSTNNDGSINCEAYCTNNTNVCTQCDNGQELDTQGACGCVFCVSTDTADTVTSADTDDTPFRNLNYIVLDHEDAQLRPSWDSWDADGAASSDDGSDGESDTEECVTISDISMLDEQHAML